MIQTVALAIVYCLVMGLVARPLLARVSDAYDEAGRVPGGWIVAIFAGVLLSAFITEEIGIAVIFGAFIMGMIMPRNAGLTHDVTQPHRGLRGHAAPADVLRLHRPAHGYRPARPARAVAHHRWC